MQLNSKEIYDLVREQMSRNEELFIARFARDFIFEKDNQSMITLYAVNQYNPKLARKIFRKCMEKLASMKERKDV